MLFSHSIANDWKMLFNFFFCSDSKSILSTCRSWMPLLYNSSYIAWLETQPVNSYCLIREHLFLCLSNNHSHSSTLFDALFFLVVLCCRHSMSQWCMAISTGQFILKICHKKQNPMTIPGSLSFFALTNYNRLSTFHRVLSLISISHSNSREATVTNMLWSSIRYFVRKAEFSSKEHQPLSCEKHITTNHAERKLLRCI